MKINKFKLPIFYLLLSLFLLQCSSQEDSKEIKKILTTIATDPSKVKEGSIFLEKGYYDFSFAYRPPAGARKAFGLPARKFSVRIKQKFYLQAKGIVGPEFVFIEKTVNRYFKVIGYSNSKVDLESKNISLWFSGINDAYNHETYKLNKVDVTLDKLYITNPHTPGFATSPRPEIWEPKKTIEFTYNE